jgi:hypothetical protein
MTKQEQEILNMIPTDERVSWLGQIRHDIKYMIDCEAAFDAKNHHNELCKIWHLEQMIIA